MAGKTCAICGKSSGMYLFCKDCLKLRDEGKVEKCTDCNRWHPTNEPCPCKKPKKEEKADKELTCIICGDPSNGKHFCYNCWNKYKDKAIEIRITHCAVTQLLDEYGNKTKRTKDGRLVRSLSEKIIMDYFFDNYVRVIYEKTIPYTNEKGEEKSLHPDFYLIDHNLYIEFNGLTNKQYLKKKEYAYSIYKNLGLNVEILEPADIDEIDISMEKLLAKYPKR